MVGEAVDRWWPIGRAEVRQDARLTSGWRMTCSVALLTSVVLSLLFGSVVFASPVAGADTTATCTPAFGYDVPASMRDDARPTVATVDIALETSWTTGRLIFKETPIRTAVAEINRYSDDKIDLQASHIADIPVSGVFDTGDAEGFIAALQDLYSVKAERRPDGTVTLSGPTA